MADYAELVADLERCAELDDDWDGYGSGAPGKLALVRAALALAYTARAGFLPEHIGASADTSGGTVCLTWTKDGCGAFGGHIEFYSDGDVVAAVDAYKPEVWDASTGLQDTIERIRRACGR